MYSYATIGTEKKSSSSFLNDAKVERVNMQCTGVQCCEYLAPNLKDLHHYAVTPESLNIIREARLASAGESRQKDANRYKYIPNAFQMYYKTDVYS
jgi:hypothetical protein